MKRRPVFGCSFLGGLLIGVALTLLIDPLNAKLDSVLSRTLSEQPDFRAQLGLAVMKVPLWAYVILGFVLLACQGIANQSRQPTWLRWPLILVQAIGAAFITFAIMVRIGVDGGYALPSPGPWPLIPVILLGIQLIVFDASQEVKPLPEPDLSDTEPVN